MKKKRLKEILKNAIISYEYELEEQDYESAECLHEVVLNELQMTEKEYLKIMGSAYTW